MEGMDKLPQKPQDPGCKPSIDEVIVAYLAEVHHIQVKPQNADIRPGRLQSAMLGAIAGAGEADAAMTAGVGVQ